MIEAASYGAEPDEPVPNQFSRLVKKSQIQSESSYVIKEANKRNGSQFRPRMSKNQTKKRECSSWLTEATSYGAEPVEPVPNRLNRFQTGSADW